MPTLEEIERERPKSVDLPAPTAWPMVLAFGVTLLFAGLVTNLAVSAAGAVLMVAAAVGWFREVLPAREGKRRFRSRRSPSSRSPCASASRGSTSRRGQHRARLPLQIHPDLGRREGRPRGLGRDGGPRRAVRRREAGQRLVSDQPARRRRLRRRFAAMPLEGLRQFHADGFLLAMRHPPADLPHGGPSLRRDAADVPAPADPARRRHRARCCGPGCSTRPSRW